MSKKTDIKICRFAGCKHDSKQIDITTDKYTKRGNFYFHYDCFQEKQKVESKDEQTKKDLQYIKEGWVLHINRTVVYSQLFLALNDLISRGISSDYLVFVFDYIVKNKLNLKYPQGFKFYVDKKEIKAAYQRHLTAKLRADNQQQKVVIKEDETKAPKFRVNQKPAGFKSILGGKK